MRITNSSSHIGYVGESFSRELHFELDEDLKDCSIYLEVEKSDGSKYVSDEIDTTSNYLIPYALLDTSGYVKLQLVAYKGDSFIRKSPSRSFFVGESINAMDALIVEEGKRNLIADLLARIDSLEERVTQLEAERLSA